MGAPYRADHVGSFLRPPELLEARLASAQGLPSVPDPERLQAIEDRHILRVLARQKELGLDVFTDGELRRRNFMSDFTDAVEGFDLGDAVARMWAPTELMIAAFSGAVLSRTKNAATRRAGNIADPLVKSAIIIAGTPIARLTAETR